MSSVQCNCWVYIVIFVEKRQNMNCRSPVPTLEVLPVGKVPKTVQAFSYTYFSSLFLSSCRQVPACGSKLLPMIANLIILSCQHFGVPLRTFFVIFSRQVNVSAALPITSDWHGPFSTTKYLTATRSTTLTLNVFVPLCFKHGPQLRRALAKRTPIASVVFFGRVECRMGSEMIFLQSPGVQDTSLNFKP